MVHNTMGTKSRYVATMASGRRASRRAALGIAEGGLHVAVAEELADDGEADALVEETGGEAVAEGVDGGLDAGLRAIAAPRFVGGAVVDGAARAAACRVAAEQGAGADAAGPQVAAKEAERLGRGVEHDGARASALSADDDLLVVGGEQEVFDVDAEGFGDAAAGLGDEGEQEAVAESLSMGFAGMRSWRKHQVRKALTEDWMRARVAGALSARVRKKRRRWTGSMAWRPPGVKSMSRRRSHR